MINFNQPNKESKKTLEIKIKEGVDFVFEQNPELSKIGTHEQYSEYLDTIFPFSRIKKIMYHGSNNAKVITDFITRQQVGDEKEFTNGVYFSENHDIPNAFKEGKNKNESTIHSGIVSTVLNARSPRYAKDLPYISYFSDEKFKKLTDEGYDSVYTYAKDEGELFDDQTTNQDYITEAVVFKNEQIHILGSKNDIEEFKNFVSKTK